MDAKKSDSVQSKYTHLLPELNSHVFNFSDSYDLHGRLDRVLAPGVPRQEAIKAPHLSPFQQVQATEGHS